MTEGRVPPNSPQGWKDYANLPAVQSLPSRSSYDHQEGANTLKQRDIYLDVHDVLEVKPLTATIVCDVLAFSQPSTTITVGSHGYLVFYVRVITADGPIHLNLEPESKSKCLLRIRASVVDQDITYSYSNGPAKKLDLGGSTGNLGAELRLQDGDVHLNYYDSYGDLGSKGTDFEASLRSQLRIATVLSWQWPLVAASLASHIISATADTTTNADLNAPALALKQQLLAQASAGPNVSFMPPLSLDAYMDALQSCITTARDFQVQYDRFQDKELSLKEKLAALGMMLDQSKAASDLHSSLRTGTLNKYKQAIHVVDQSKEQFAGDQKILEMAQERLKVGIEKWKEEQRLKAIVGILTAITAFAASIGSLFVGDAAVLAGVPSEIAGAVKTAEEAAKASRTLKLAATTLEKVGKAAEACYKLYEAMKKAVDDMEKLQKDPNTKIPTRDNNGDAKGDTPGAVEQDVDADLTSIVSLSEWKQWQLESDAQLADAVELKIDGAKEYRLALSKHALNGMLLAQAQAQAVKAGQEYVKAQLEASLSAKDIDSIEKLKQEYKEEEDQVKKAESLLYDRLLAVRTNVVIELRYACLAFKYYTLEDSSVKLDLLKPIPEYDRDVSTIKLEVQNAESKYNDDQTPVTTSGMHVKDLPLDYPSEVIPALKRGDKASFTLAPQGDPDSPNLAGPFVGGSLFRLKGLSIHLIGAHPLEGQDSMEVTIDIYTTGLYADIKDDGTISHFISRPLHREFGYTEDKNGETHTTKHSIFPSLRYARPTPFTQWIFKIKNPQDLDLSQLTDIKLKWSYYEYLNQD